MSERLSALAANRLRDKLILAVDGDSGDFRTAAQWHQDGFGDYTQGQIKRQLEVLARAGRVSVRRCITGDPAVYYGPKRAQ